MTLDLLQPKTLAGIKSLARQLRTRENISQYDALRRAASQAGFSNYKTALNYFGLADVSVPVVGHPLFITTWWWDERERTSGRETLLIHTKLPFAELLTHRQRRQNRYLGWYKLEANDLITDERRYTSQSQARLHAAGAARTIAFIEATGFKPSGAKLRQAVPAFDDGNGLPGRDHYAVWRHSETDQLILTDEPYQSRIERDGPAFERRRLAWAQKHEWTVMPVDWGMYYPDGGSKLFVAASNSEGVDLSALVKKLNALPQPVGSHEWNGESTSTSEAFWTPGLIAKQQQRRAPRKPTEEPVRHRNSIAYTKSLSGERRSRPAAKLDLAHHRKMGDLLKIAMLSTEMFSRAGRSLSSVQSELDDWLALEYPRDVLPDKEFKQYYYGRLSLDLDGKTVRERAGSRPAMLAEVRGILATNYPDSAPLRNMLKRIDALIGEQ